MELDCREDCCGNCVHAIQTDVDGWVVCQIDDRSKDEDMVCDRFEWNVKWLKEKNMQEIMIGFTEEQYKVIDEYLNQYECETVQEAIIKAIEHYMAEH